MLFWFSKMCVCFVLTKRSLISNHNSRIFLCFIQYILPRKSQSICQYQYSNAKSLLLGVCVVYLQTFLVIYKFLRMNPCIFDSIRKKLTDEEQQSKLSRTIINIFIIVCKLISRAPKSQRNKTWPSLRKCWKTPKIQPFWQNFRISL